MTDEIEEHGIYEAYRRLRDAVSNILAANDEFRSGMPDEWEGDPLQYACEAARGLVGRTHHE